MARSEDCWITGPSAIGSENGTPSSSTSAPAATRACITGTVASTEGSPAVMKGIRPGRPATFSAAKRASMRFMAAGTWDWEIVIGFRDSEERIGTKDSGQHGSWTWAIPDPDSRIPMPAQGLDPRCIELDSVLGHSIHMPQCLVRQRACGVGFAPLRQQIRITGADFERGGITHQGIELMPGLITAATGRDGTCVEQMALG